MPAGARRGAGRRAPSGVGVEHPMTRRPLGWVRTVALDSAWIALALFVIGLVPVIAVVRLQPLNPHDGVITLDDGANIPFKTAGEHDSIIAAHRGHVGSARYQTGYANDWVRGYVLFVPFVIVAGYVLLRERSRLRSWFRPSWGWTVAAAFVGIAAQTIATVYGHLGERMGLNFEGPRIYRQLLEHNDFRVAAIVLAPVVEELYFRGRMYSIVQSSAGRGTALVVTSTLFTLAHVWIAPAAIPSYAVISILLAWLRGRTAGLVAPIVAHSVFNASALAWMALQARSGS